MAYGRNLPPMPPPAVVERGSFEAHVWRGDRHDDVGLGVTQGTGHLVTVHLGVAQSEVIELRATERSFFPGQPHDSTTVQPTFLAFLAGTEERAGTAWPHPDGKGHRLKLRQALPDGSVLELRDPGHYAAIDTLVISTRKRRPSSRPRANA